MLRLPWLNRLYISGICELSHLLRASPNLDKFDVDFNCLKILLDHDSTHCLFQIGIQRLIILDWIGTETDLVQRIIHTFGSLHHFDIIMKERTLNIDSFVLAILPFYRGRMRISLGVQGLLSEEVTTNIRQWVIDHSYLTAEDSFAVQYCNNCFQLWL